MLPKCRVFGIDIEPDMVKYLAERAKRQGLSTLCALKGAPDDLRPVRELPGRRPVQWRDRPDHRCKGSNDQHEDDVAGRPTDDRGDHLACSGGAND